DGDAEDAAHDKCERQRQPPDAAGIDGHEAGEGAEHEDLGVGEIEPVEHAQHQRKADRDQRVHAAHDEAVQDLGGHGAEWAIKRGTRRAARFVVRAADTAAAPTRASRSGAATGGAPRSSRGPKAFAPLRSNPAGEPSATASRCFSATIFHESARLASANFSIAARESPAPPIK